MKKVLILMAILLFVASAHAAVVTCVNEGSNIVRLDYNTSDENSLPIAFALDVRVDGGATITRVYDYKVGDSTSAAPGFGIFPTAMVIDSNGTITNPGTPVSTGLGTASVTLAMASRYSGSTNAPRASGTLCRVLVAPNGAQTVNVTVAQNTAGGGVVLENTTITTKFSGIGVVLGSTTPPPPQAPPAPASINYPATSSTGQYIVNWASSTGATSYQLERSNNNGATWTQIYSGTSISYTENIGNGSYRYHVRATNATGSSSWTTGTANCVVSIASIPPAPASITYPATSTTGQYTISWPASAGAASYQLERSANNGSTWTAVYSGTALSYAENIGNGSYRYHVRATNTAGSSTWTIGTANCAVTIATSIPAPASITYPTVNHTGRYNISWPAVTGAASYQLERSADNANTWTAVYSGASLTYAENVGNGSYRYRVKATNNAAVSSLWRTGTATCVVTLPPQAPATISYPTSSNTGKFQVTWPASVSATSYQLQRSNNNGSTWAQIYSGVALTFAQTLPNGSYRYRVRATSAAGSSSWTTGTVNCVVVLPPQAPASITYPTVNHTGRYTVSWPASANTNSYQLQRSANNGATWTTVYSGTSLSYAENIGNGSYRYRVNATNIGGTSIWRTGTATCVVTLPPQAPASVNYPSSSSTGRFTVTWPASTSATSYQLQRTNNNGSTWVQIYSGSALSFAQTLPNGSYRYRIRATSAAGSSAWTTGSWNCVVSIRTDDDEHDD